MRTSQVRNTGRVMSKMSFQMEVKELDKIEKVSRRRQVSQSQLIREFIESGLIGWDC
jgi:hypothetical protein